MALIKSNNAPATLTPFSMKDIEGHARRVLMQAQRRATELLLAAQEEAEKLKKQQHAKGLAEGRAEGLAAGLEEGRKAGHQQALAEHQANLTQLTTALSSGLEQLEAQRRQLEAEAGAEVIRLAVAIARRAAKKLGATDAAVLSANIDEAMKLVVHARDVRVAIHPSQRATLFATLPQLKLKWPALEHVELIEDATLAPGGCRIFTRGGEVDAALDEQIDRIAAELVPQTQEER